MVYGIWVTHVGSWDVCTYILYPIETAIVIRISYTQSRNKLLVQDNVLRRMLFGCNSFGYLFGWSHPQGMSGRIRRSRTASSLVLMLQSPSSSWFAVLASQQLIEELDVHHEKIWPPLSPATPAAGLTGLTGGAAAIQI